MIFNRLDISGAFLIERQRHEDNRGYFARTFCEQEFIDHGISFKPVQANISYNEKPLTLRGMHFHTPPQEEEKLVSCNSGRVFDVIVDIRPSSQTYGTWFGTELSRKNGKSLFIPKGCAHGFLTLEEFSEVTYLMSPSYVSGYEAGIRWDDSDIKIEWPEKPMIISEKDEALPLLRDLQTGVR